MNPTRDATGRATKAVVLAAGLGTRMRRDDGAGRLDDAQSRVADTGVKALIPIGRPFLDHVLSVLAGEGVADVCLVIGPGHDRLRRYYETVPAERLTFAFATQPEPRGTADALRAAEAFAGGDDFLMLNSDNYYPASAIGPLVRAGGPALVGFSRDGMLAGGNVPASRLNAFAAVESTVDGRMARVVEKPDDAELDRLASRPGGVRLSMNCWRFPPAIFASCAAIGPSSRGEFEVPDAVQHAAGRGVRFDVIPCDDAVLDLSSRADVAGVTERLAGREVRL